MPPPVLPPAGNTNRNPFTNPFVPDASGRNGFQRAGEILRDTFTGVTQDVKTAGGLLPGPTGAAGETTRTGQGFGFDVKSIVVYGVAALFVILGLRGLLK